MILYQADRSQGSLSLPFVPLLMCILYNDLTQLQPGFVFVTLAAVREGVFVRRVWTAQAFPLSADRVARQLTVKLSLLK